VCMDGPDRCLMVRRREVMDDDGGGGGGIWKLMIIFAEIAF